MSRTGLPLVVAATAAAAVVAGLASTTNAGATPASQKLAAGIATSKHALPNTRAAKAPQALPAGVPKSGSYAFLLQLGAKSTTAVQRSAMSRGAAVAKTAGKNQLAAVTSEQNAVIKDLPSGSKVIYRSHAVLAGVAVTTDVKNFGKLTGIAGVSHVYAISPKSPSNSYAVPLQGAPQAWVAAGDRGEHATIAIIDTGIDYTHKDFGGAGTVADYQAAKAQLGEPVSPNEFPGPKVIGGYDLAGDAYQADPNSPNFQPTPSPDKYPLDCNSHGTHVAGTAAGYGVTANGQTYGVNAQGQPVASAYSKKTPFSTLRIGPGVAPLAKLYAFRVFGCEGSTDLVGAALDRAADPNGDGTGTPVDVVNMSLGSDFGSPQDGDAVASDAASKLGITVVVASGNNGDLYDTGGSPGNAPSTIAVAASQDASAVVDGLNVKGPASIAGQYGAERSIAFDYSKGDLKGTVAQVKDPSNLDGCDPLSTADAAAVNGKIAFVEWTDDDTARRCGSVGRSTNLVNAGATGFIFANDEESFAAGITGSATIPGVLVAKSGGDAIRTELAAGHTVRIGSTTPNAVTQIDEGLNDTLAGFSSRGIRGAANLKPDVTAVGASVFSAGNGTGDQGLNDSGTSMATPMVAGTAGLVTSQHPDWTPEQVKADIMNTANQNLYAKPNHAGAKYAPNRVGSGRIDIKQAAANAVLAYVKDDPGVVSASFGPVEVTADKALTKTITVQNTGFAAATYSVEYQSRTQIPGAVWSVSPPSVTIGARSKAEVTVTLTLTKADLTKTIDPTVDRLQGGLPREYVADTSGLVVFKSPGVPNLRVPTYAAPRPTSTMTQAASLTLPAGAVQKAFLPLTGGQVNNGSGTTAVQSTVAGFELQATSGLAPDCSATVLTSCVSYPDQRAADLKYVGSTSDAPQLGSIGEDPLTSSNGFAYFSITTQKPWRSPASFQEFDVLIDTNGDGKADVVTYNTRLTPASDIFVAQTVNLTTGKVDNQLINDRFGDTDTALFDSDTLVMPVLLSNLPGVTATHSRITYAVQSFAAGVSGALDTVGTVASSGAITGGLSMDVLHPGVAVYGSYNGDTSALLYADSPGSVLAIRRDAAAYATDKGQGALLVHFQNAVGNKAQRLSFSTETSLTITPNPVVSGAKATGTVTVTGGTADATGAVTISHGRTVFGSGTLSNGKAVIPFSVATVGTFTFFATYAGDAKNAGSTSPLISLTIKAKPGVSGVTIVFTPSPVKHGATTTAGVTVRVPAGSPAATGTVKLVRTDGKAAVVGTGALVNGKANIAYKPAAAGVYHFRIDYSGDSHYSPGSTGVVNLRAT